MEYIIQSVPVLGDTVPVLQAHRIAAMLANTQERMLQATMMPSTLMPERRAAVRFPPTARMSRPKRMCLNITYRKTTNTSARIARKDTPVITLVRPIQVSASGTE